MSIILEKKMNICKNLLLVAGLMACGTAQGAAIAVVNSDFEADGHGDGALVIGAPSGWTHSSLSGQFNPLGTQPHYSNMGDGDANGGVLANMDGPTFVFMFLGNGNAGEVSQELTEVLAVNTEYTLTVAIGMRNWFNGGQITKDFRIALETTGGSVVADFTADVLNQNPNNLSENSAGDVTAAESTFTDYSAVGSTAGAPAGLGEALVIRIQGLADGRYLDFDNVRLTGVAVPEPTSLALVGLGVLAMVRRQR